MNLDQPVTALSFAADWSWIAGTGWVAAITSLLAMWVAARRRTVIAHFLFAVAAGVAALFAGPVVAAAVIGIAAASRMTGRRIRRIDRARRFTQTAGATLLLLWSIHVAATLPATRNDVTIVVVLLVSTLTATVWKPAPPELDPVRSFTAAQRNTIIKRDGNRCGYCGVDGNALGVQLAVDHVLAHSRGGRTHIDNGKMACTPCNSSKSDRSMDDFTRTFRRAHGFAPGQFERGLFKRRTKL